MCVVNRTALSIMCIQDYRVRGDKIFNLSQDTHLQREYIKVCQKNKKVSTVEFGAGSVYLYESAPIQKTP